MSAPVAPARPKVVLLGMMSAMPVAGVVWQNLHYLLGFERLGYEAYYVESHARTPSMLMRDPGDDSSALAAAFIDRIMRRFDLGERWAFNALHADGRAFGMSRERQRELYASAELLIDLHGGTTPLPELYESDRLVYLETDPVQLQLELESRRPETIEFLEPHCAFFTFAENLGAADCRLPVSEQFEFRPTRQPVVLDLWNEVAGDAGDAFTTVGNWRQPWRNVFFHGETYTWSKDDQFERFIELPQRIDACFELALSSYSEADAERLRSHGWRVRDAHELSGIDPYRDYIAGSRGEFTVAKDQNVRLRTGWFSDRSATYLAAGRPVITQETGFSNTLPSGTGLFGFSEIEEVASAVTAIESDYPRASAAAAEIARECFDSRVVLGRMLSELGLSRAGRRSDTARAQRDRGAGPFPAEMPLIPVSRRPIELPAETISAAMRGIAPRAAGAAALGPGSASVVVVTYENLALTRLCLESLLHSRGDSPLEVIVVDNGSRDGTTQYLAGLATRHRHVRILLNGYNAGFAGACNQGLELARGDRLVLLNNDTMLAPGTFPRLLAHLDDPTVGLVGPVTNRIGNEAEVATEYRTWGQFLAEAEARAATHPGRSFELAVPAMFCLAMTRATYERLSPLDTRFEVGMLEDDDYAERARAAGYRLLCAEDVLVHHFGEASFGKLVPTGEHARLLRANQQRFEEKWGKPWQPYGRRLDPRYREMVARVRGLVSRQLPPGAVVAVVSRGDDDLVDLPSGKGLHFPQDPGGLYAGHHPADSDEAIRELKAIRRKGAGYLLLPETALWWLEHYDGLREHLGEHCPVVAHCDGTGTLFDLSGLRVGDAGGPEALATSKAAPQ
ncbi:MAG: glycosyltransferase family 2 protein [bacterium]